MGTLLVGAGGTGVLVVRRVKALLGCGATAAEILAIDQDERSTPAPIDLGALERHERLVLAGADARVMLRHAAAWQPYLSWLPKRPEMHTVDELAPAGGGRQRWLGRLAFFAHDQVIRDALRASVARLTQRAGDVDSIALVVSLGGGTGSGMFTDLTYLAEAVAPSAARVAYLLLPEMEPSAPDLERGNAYAALREILWLKTRRLAFRANYPRIGGRDAAASGEEPWQRLFLFAPRAGESAPYFAAVDAMAQAIAIQLREEVGGEVMAQSQRRVDIAGQDGGVAAAAECCFSTCATASDAEEAALGVGPTMPAALAGGPSEEPRPVEAGPPLPGIAGNRWFVDLHVAQGLREAADLWIAAALEQSAELVERCPHERRSWFWGRKTDLTLGTERDLRQLERAVAKVAGRDLTWKPDPNLRGRWPWWHRPARPEVRARGAEDSDELPAAWRAREVLEDLRTYLRQADRGAGERVTQEAEIVPGDEDEQEFASLGDSWVAILADDANGAFPVSRLKRRCAAINGIVGHRAFRRRLRKRLAEQLPQDLQVAAASASAGVAAAAGEAAAEAPAPGAETAEINAMPEEHDGFEAAADPIPAAVGEAVAGGPVLQAAPAEWQQRIDLVVARLDREIFAPAGASTRRRSFGVALIPERMAREAGGDSVAAYLGPALGCRCRWFVVPEDRVTILVLDLNRSPCDIRGFGALLRAYKATPAKDRFHIDMRYLESQYDDPCEARLRPFAPVYCGNAGCRKDIAEITPAARCCPGCGRSIRSRCENVGCDAGDLDRRVDGRSLTCPVCRGFNHAAWWLCWRHGRVPLWVPIDKAACPECIRRHQEDDAAFPLDGVARRPCDVDRRECPNCVRLAALNVDHEVFTLPAELARFYDDGVNGHDLARMAELSERYQLGDGYRCPRCFTPLIPADGIEAGAPTSPAASRTWGVDL